MTSPSTKEITRLRTELAQWLKEKLGESAPKQVVRYEIVAKAFPGEPHQYSFDICAIDKQALKQWCSEHGLEASFMSENVDSKYFKRGEPTLLFGKPPKI